MQKCELDQVLALHNKWLHDDSKGIRANLEGAYLEGADLRWANLEGAYLKGANLEGADLRWANLDR